MATASSRVQTTTSTASLSPSAELKDLGGYGEEPAASQLITPTDGRATSVTATAAANVWAAVDRAGARYGNEFRRSAGGALDALFNAKAVALIGATERESSVGRTILENLQRCRAAAKAQFKIYPVNPGRSMCCGLPCYRDVREIPDEVDLAVVVTPAKTVASVVDSCGQKGAAVAVVISAGFKEIGAEGLRREQELHATARKHNLRIIGPNCLGVMSPSRGINATFAAGDALPGHIAFLSQSGAMCTAVLDWSIEQQLGFSAFVSIGSMCDVQWGDLLDALAVDPQTACILIYMESVGDDAPRFLSAARACAARKPVVVIKAGRTAAAAQAAASHTGSLTGSHESFVAAMKRAGVLVVDNLAELCNFALLLGKQPAPAGGNLLIITNAGGPGVLATDAAAIAGATVYSLGDSTVDAMNKFLPAAWSHGNPVDLLGDASPELYARALDVAARDPAADGVLVVLSPQSVTDPTKTAQAVVAACARLQQLPDGPLRGKPVFCAWMGGTVVTPGSRLLNAAGIPTFAYPDDAAAAFGKLWKHAEWQLRAAEVLAVSVEPAPPATAREAALQLVQRARAQQRDVLTEDESKQVLQFYGIPVAGGCVCSTADEAVAAARKAGFPVAVKLHSRKISHKSDVGGVQLNLKSESDVRHAVAAIIEGLVRAGHDPPTTFEGVSVQPMLSVAEGTELILGSYTDPQFGPLVLFGAGGTAVEVFRDTAVGVPPLTPALARLLIDSTKVARMLNPTAQPTPAERFRGTDIAALTATLCRFSLMVADLVGVVTQCDVNPLLVLQDRSIALDARMFLSADGGGASRLLVQPYPSSFVFRAPDGLVVRPLTSNDGAAFCKLQHHVRSAQARQFFGGAILPTATRSSAPFVASVVTPDYSRFVALGLFASAELRAVARLRRLTSCLSVIDLGILMASDNIEEPPTAAAPVVTPPAPHTLFLLARAIDVARAYGGDRIIVHSHGDAPTAALLGELLTGDLGFTAAASRPPADHGYDDATPPIPGHLTWLLDIARQQTRSKC